MLKRIYNYLEKKISAIKPLRAFWFTILLMAFVYNINHTISSRPLGIHQWRNCVSAGYASSYYHGADFLEPRTEAYMSKDMTSNVMLLEAPLLYYVVGTLYKIFGQHEFLFRLTNLLIGFFGLFFIFKVSYYYLKNIIVSLSIPIILFSSTVYTFYLNNFITDSTGISISLIGVYFFYKFYDKKKYLPLIISMLFFALAGLLKVQSLYIYFSLLAVFFIELIFNFNFGKNKEKLFYKPILTMLLFVSVIIIVVAWYYYAKLYTKAHGTLVDSSRLSSVIWNFDKDARSVIWNELVSRFKAGYFHSPNFLYFSFLLFIHNLIFIKKHNRLLNAIVFFLFIQIIIFNIMFFQSIGRCDYYNINSFVLILFIYINFFLYIKVNYLKVFKNKFFVIGIMILSMFLIYRGNRGLHKKYSDWFYYDSNKIVEKCGNINPYLRQLGIRYEDKVYYTPDPSQNISLYLMDQPGNTDMGLSGSFNEKIEFLRKRDLKYIMVGDENLLEKHKQNSEFLNDSNKIGEFNGVHIFEVK